MKPVNYIRSDDNGAPNTYRIDFSIAINTVSDLDLEESPVSELSIDAENSTEETCNGMLDYFCENSQYLSSLENLYLINFSINQYTPKFFQFLDTLEANLTQIHFRNSDISIGLSNYLSSKCVPTFPYINHISFDNIKNFETLDAQIRETIIHNLSESLVTHKINFQNFFITNTRLSDSEATLLIDSAMFSNTLTNFDIPRLCDYMIDPHLLHFNLATNSTSYDLHSKYSRELKSYRESINDLRENFNSELLNSGISSVDNKFITTLFKRKREFIKEEFDNITKSLLDFPDEISTPVPVHKKSKIT